MGNDRPIDRVRLAAARTEVSTRLRTGDLATGQDGRHGAAGHGPAPEDTP
jgi:hypothetical protein